MENNKTNKKHLSSKRMKGKDQETRTPSPSAQKKKGGGKHDILNKSKEKMIQRGVAHSKTSGGNIANTKLKKIQQQVQQNTLNSTMRTASGQRYQTKGNANGSFVGGPQKDNQLSSTMPHSSKFNQTQTLTHPANAGFEETPGQSSNTVSYLRPIKGTSPGDPNPSAIQVQNWTKNMMSSPKQPKKACKKVQQMPPESEEENDPAADTNPKQLSKQQLKKKKATNNKEAPVKNSPNKKAGGYLDALADQEANLISMNSLQEGEEFEKDINNIISIIDGVEKGMNQERLTNQFTRSANLSFNRRKLEMTRTLQAQNNHQTNFIQKQTYIKQQAQQTNKAMQGDIMSSGGNRLIKQFSQKNYGPRFQPKSGGAHPNLVRNVHNEHRSQNTLNLGSGDENTNDNDSHQQFIGQNQRYATIHQQQNFGIRIGKKRPMTTKNASNLYLTKKGYQSMSSGINRSNQSGAFQFNKQMVNRDRSGNSDEQTRDNMTSAVTGQGHNPASHHQYLAQHFSGKNLSSSNHINPNNQELEIFSDQTPIHSRVDGGTHQSKPQISVRDQEHYFMSPKGMIQSDQNKERIASAKEGHRYKRSTDNFQKRFANVNAKSQLNVGQAHVGQQLTMEHSGSPARGHPQGQQVIPGHDFQVNNIDQSQLSNANLAGNSNMNLALNQRSHLSINHHLIQQNHSAILPMHMQGPPFVNVADNVSIQDAREVSNMLDKDMTNIKIPQRQKLVMQVNKYIPHFQRIPVKLDKKDIVELQNDFMQSQKDERASQIAATASRLNRVDTYISNFDNVLLDSLLVDREKKYRTIFQREEDEESEGAKKEETSVHKRRKRRSPKQTNKNKGISGYDSDEERENAHQMFMEDIKALRNCFLEGLDEQVRVQDELTEKFNKERQFFLESAQKGQNNTNDLENIIKQLKSEIQEERDYSIKIWADEQVNLMCQKALFTYKYLNQNQQDQITGLDMRENPEGHIIVSKAEQNAVLQVQTEKKGSSLNIQELDMLKVANSRDNFLQGESSIEDQGSQISALPSAREQEHLLEVENLKWQIQYEKKLHWEMSQLLENKVSNLMADVKELDKKISQLGGTIQERDLDKVELQKVIDKLERTISDQRGEVRDLKNTIDDLEHKGGPLSPVKFDELYSQLAVANQELKQKDSKIQQLEGDLKRTVDALKDFHLRMVKLDSFANFQTSSLQELVDRKIQEQTNRIQQVTETFKDALMLSNKTYFLEEVNKHKIEKKNLKREMHLLKIQIKTLEKTTSFLKQDNLRFQLESAECRKVVAENPELFKQRDYASNVPGASSDPQYQYGDMNTFDSGKRDLTAENDYTNESPREDLLPFDKTIPKGMKKLEVHRLSSIQEELMQNQEESNKDQFAGSQVSSGSRGGSHKRTLHMQKAVTQGVPKLGIPTAGGPKSPSLAKGQTMAAKTPASKDDRNLPIKQSHTSPKRQEQLDF